MARMIARSLQSPELARMIGDHLIAQQHDDTLRMRAHEHHTSGGTRIDAVAIAIGRDQTRGAGSHRLLDEAVEGTTQFHQARAFVLEHVPDSALLNFGCLVRRA